MSNDWGHDTIVNPCLTLAWRPTKECACYHLANIADYIMSFCEDSCTLIIIHITV
jgi:hypothetical protein